LTELDVRNNNNSIITDFYSFDNPNLTCLYVDDASASYLSSWFKDTTSNFVNNEADCQAIIDALNAVTLIPDANFEQKLIDLGIDTNGFTGNILNVDAASINILSISSSNISSIQGIEAFVNLTTLYADYNNLSTVDLSANTQLLNIEIQYNQLTTLNLTGLQNLQSLKCHQNLLTQLDVSDSILLSTLIVANNQLTALNLTGLQNLQYLYCQYNGLTQLDVSDNPNLTGIVVVYNQLTELDVRNGNNSIINNFTATDNPNLTCIYVDDASASYLSSWNKDTATTFVNNEAECQAIIDALDAVTLIPDANFEQKLIDLGIDTNGFTGDILNVDAAPISNLNISSSNISSIQGIEAFVNLTTLFTNDNNLSTVDLSTNILLHTVQINSNQLTSLDFTGLQNLQSLECNQNLLTQLDVSTNTLLSYLSAEENSLTSLDLSNNPNLTVIWVSYNQLTELDVRNGNNSIIFSFYSWTNPNLTCIYVDDASAGYLGSWNKDTTSTFVNNETECATLSSSPFANDNFALYPNPVHDYLTIEIGNSSISKSEIYDLTGKKILETKSNILNVNHLENGIYMIKITAENGAVTTQKIIKN